MIHPDTELKFISSEIGYGVVATRFIPKGTVTWALDKFDNCFTPRQVSEMDDVYQKILSKYSYRDQHGDFVLCWDIARFINHSFNSNCISTAYNFELAVRDIQPGEELTDDYGYLNCVEPFNCLPEAGTNRSCVMPDDLLYYFKEWDAKLVDTFKYFNLVSQPLSYFIDEKWQSKVAAVAEGFETMDSILNCFFSSDQDKLKVKERLLLEYEFALVMQ